METMSELRKKVAAYEELLAILEKNCNHYIKCEGVSEGVSENLKCTFHGRAVTARMVLKQIELTRTYNL